eukprot:7566931-Pyramimonas_sp.AAC.1
MQDIRGSQFTVQDKSYSGALVHGKAVGHQVATTTNATTTALAAATPPTTTALTTTTMTTTKTTAIPTAGGRRWRHAPRRGRSRAWRRWWSGGLQPKVPSLPEFHEQGFVGGVRGPHQAVEPRRDESDRPQVRPARAHAPVRASAPRH